MNYRLLYFFHGQAAVPTHGLTKEDEVSDADIVRAIERKQKFQKRPAAHTCEEELKDGEDS